MSQRQPRTQRLRRQALAFQRGNMNGVSIFPEQSCQRPLAQVSAYHPNITFSVHPIHETASFPPVHPMPAGEKGVAACFLSPEEVS